MHTIHHDEAAYWKLQRIVNKARSKGAPESDLLAEKTASAAIFRIRAFRGLRIYTPRR